MDVFATLKRVRQILHAQNRVLWPVSTAIVALVVFLSTLQVGINGSGHAYATDVGEIQNALPRWGLIHRSGYPLYTAAGSLFVTLLRWIGIEPAMGASLFSTLWGVIFVASLVVLIQHLGASGPAAALGALSVALSTGVWIDASLAEVHTLTLVFTAATLLFALRFGRTGERRDLLLLALFFTQGVSHQRSVILLAPAVAVLSWPQWRAFLSNFGLVLAVSLLAFLVYLYMPFRVWTGATWVFGSPGTWGGFWEMVFDNRGGRVFTLSTDLAEWSARVGVTLEILSDDMLWLLLILGLTGLLLLIREGKWREGLGMTLAWVPNFLLSIVIWRGRVIDAQLAAKLPVIVLAGVGLAVLLERTRRWSRPIGIATVIVLALTLVVWGWQVRPFVLSITRDPSAQDVIDMAEQLFPLPEDRLTSLVVLWGHDYWALAYAQGCRGQLQGLNLADHNVNVRSVAEDGRLLTPDETFVVLSPAWWEARLGGRLHLSSAAPGIVELDTKPPVNAADVPMQVGFDLGNGIRIRDARLAWEGEDKLRVTIYWQAVQPVEPNYRIAVHLVAKDPPESGEDILAQADALNPVGGWYPTSLWAAGEVVRDDYALAVRPGSLPVAVRVAMYEIDADGAFVDTDWLSLPVPASRERTE
jgi:hypothetical protein